MKLKIDPVTVGILLGFLALWAWKFMNYKTRISCQEYNQIGCHGKLLGIDISEHWYHGHPTIKYCNREKSK